MKLHVLIGANTTQLKEQTQLYFYAITERSNVAKFKFPMFFMLFSKIRLNSHPCNKNVKQHAQAMHFA